MLLAIFILRLDNLWHTTLPQKTTLESLRHVMLWRCNINLAQMRIAVRDALVAGKGLDTVVGEDFFYQDAIINYYLQEGQSVLYQTIRRAKSDYFSRILRTTDPVLVLRQKTFDPSTLKMQSGVGNYTLPPDFMRMKLITDQRIDAPKSRFRASDVTSSDFRTVYSDTTSSRISPYLFDILGLRTMIIRPIPVETFDVEYIYEKMLDPMNDYSVGSASINRGQTVISFTAATDFNFLSVGDEIILGASLLAPQTIDPSAVYPVIIAKDSGAMTVTIDGPLIALQDYAGATFIRSRAPEIPELYHYLLPAYAIREGLRKGTNANAEMVGIWEDKWDKGLPDLIADVETRQISDTETSEAYLEGEEWN